MLRDFRSLESKRLLLDFEKRKKEFLLTLPADHHRFSDWAISIAASRALTFLDDRAEEPTAMPITALVPIADFCNHSFSPTAVLHAQQSHESMNPEMVVPGADATNGERWLHVTAATPLEEGDEVTLAYAPYSEPNLEIEERWRMQWGFVPLFDPAFRPMPLRRVEDA
jgi:hypothetical protein